MSYNQTPALGAATSANSLPVVIASDQVSIPVGLSSVNFVYSSLGANTTATQLATTATFTGTIEAIPYQPAFSILLFSDFNGTLIVNQYMDAAGTQKVYSKTYTYTANSQFAISGAANGDYFQVTFQNTGGSTTTKLRLETAYGVIDAANALNNKPMSLSDVGGVSITTGQSAAASSLPVTLSNENVQDLYVTGQAAQTALVNNILTVASGSTATDVQQYRAFAVQVVSTGTAGAYIFEGSNDNTNFQAVPVFNQALLTGVPIVTAITATSSQIIYVGACNFRYLRLRISTVITGGSVQAFSTFTQTPFAATQFIVAQATAANLNVTATGTVTANLGTGGTAATSLGKAEDAAAASGDTVVAIAGVRNDLLTSNVSASGDYIVPVTDTYGALIVKDQQRHKATYRTAFVVSPAASATDVFQLIGSATKTVEITKIIISGTQTTAGLVDFYVKKRSTANTGGTSSASTNVPLISTDAAATAVGAIYTANPSALGTDVGNIYIQALPIGASTASTNNIVEINFGERGRALILSGVAQALAINLNGVTVTGGSLKITVEFLEY